MKVTFSGHESFTCKSLWLKKGCDYLIAGNNFSQDDAVVKLGVGKNMVSSIRYWLKVFGLTEDDKLNTFARYIFQDSCGYDEFVEDKTTLWLLHYNLLKTKKALLYRMTFVDFHRENRTFSRGDLQKFVKRQCDKLSIANLYNENTVKRDINILIGNYSLPIGSREIDDYSALLLNLGLISRFHSNDSKTDQIVFNDIHADDIDSSAILYMLLDLAENSSTLSGDVLLNLSLALCMPIDEFIGKIQEIVKKYPENISYTNNSGIKNIQILNKISKYAVLDNYYQKNMKL